MSPLFHRDSVRASLRCSPSVGEIPLGPLTKGEIGATVTFAGVQVSCTRVQVPLGKGDLGGSPNDSLGYREWKPG
jgi:hypothetical protein